MKILNEKILNIIFENKGGMGNPYHDKLGRFCGKELDNSKGQRGFGNRIFEYKNKRGERVTVVHSQYSHGMARGKSLGGYSNISHYINKLTYKPSLEKEYDGTGHAEKAIKFLKKTYSITHKL